MFTSFIQYLALLPSYVNILMVSKHWAPWQGFVYLI
jgi:hypothetical protein